MTRINVPTETLVVEMEEDGLNIVETFMQMSSRTKVPRWNATYVQNRSEK